MRILQSISTRVSWIFNNYKFMVVGAKTGKFMRIAGDVKLSIGVNASLIVNDNFTLTSGSFYNPLSRNIKSCIIIEDNAKLNIGKNVGISSSCLWVHNYLTIGNNVKIGADTIILDSNAHSLDFIKRRNYYEDSPNTLNAGIEIGDDVLIGTRCILLKGIKIGSRSIIGAGSVVTKDIPPDCIAAGNPCKPIKKLNEYSS